MRGPELLSSFYETEKYRKLGAQVVERVGTVGILETNEKFILEHLHLSSKPDGYIVGVGNGAIWHMLDLFPDGVLPRGVISLDRDPSVILSGLVLLELGRREITSDEATTYFYGGKIDALLDIAKNLVQNEPGDRFKQTLNDVVSTGQFAQDLEVLYWLETHPDIPDIRRRKNITSVIHRQWPVITTFAKEEKMFFLHSDIADETIVRLIIEHTPDITSCSNILYTSNIVDKRYRKDIDIWELFNPNHLSWYVFTSAKDDYVLQCSRTPPHYRE